MQPKPMMPKVAAIACERGSMMLLLPGRGDYSHHNDHDNIIGLPISRSKGTVAAGLCRFTPDMWGWAGAGGCAGELCKHLATVSHSC